MFQAIHIHGVPDVAQVGVLDLDGISVPVVEMAMLDERTGCASVLRYQAGELQGVPGDYTGCPAYSGRLCRMQGGGALCAFHEPDSAPIWRKAQRWRLLEWPDGKTAVTLAHSALEIASDCGARVVGLEVVTV